MSECIQVSKERRHRMKRLTTLVVALGLLASLATGCGGGSPSDVAKAFYRTGNEGNYAKAESYMSINMQMAFEMVGLGMDFENAMDVATRYGTIAQIEVRGVEEYPGGYQAMVYLTLHYTDGSEAQDYLMLQKEDGNWKIMQSSLLITGSLWYP
jgi:hypothetical protein